LLFFKGHDTRIRLNIEPSPGDPGYVQWKDAMKMVARLPEGVPQEFRRKVRNSYLFFPSKKEKKKESPLLAFSN